MEAPSIDEDSILDSVKIAQKSYSLHRTHASTKSKKKAKSAVDRGQSKAVDKTRERPTVAPTAYLCNSCRKESTFDCYDFMRCGFCDGQVFETLLNRRASRDFVAV